MIRRDLSIRSTMRSLVQLSTLGLLTGMVLSGCALPYQYVQPEVLVVDDYRYTLDNQEVELGLDYDVLVGSRGSRYARMARRNRVSLVVIRVRNAGENPIRMPEDLCIETDSGEFVQPFDKTSGVELLIKPITFSDNPIQPNGRGSIGIYLLVQMGMAASNSTDLISHIRFAKDMEDHYLENCIIGAGEEATGYLVLPVTEGTPLQISLR